MNDQVSEVKTKTDIVTIIGERIELKKAGSKYKAPCPFHSERTPSFVISPELQIYKCFGCQKSGDVFTFLEEFEGMDFPESLKYLADRAGVKLVPLKGQQKGIKERYYDINAHIAKFYHYVLTKHPSGKVSLSYLTTERGLKISTIEKFQLGYSPQEPLALRKYVVEKQKVSIKELEEVGAIYSHSGRPIDRFRGRVIFPLYDHRGNIAGFAGRILPQVEKNLPPGQHVGKYVNSPETPIYKKSRMLYGLSEVRQDIKKAHEVVVVEGELDMISSWQAGIKNVVAIKGSALTDEQVDLLSRFTKTIILALDADFAGNEAAQKAIVKADREGIQVKVCSLGEFKDPDEIARKDPEKFRNNIKNAINIWDFLIDVIFKKYTGSGGDAKAKISKELVPVLSSIEDKIVQAHYVSQAAKKLQIPTEAVLEQIKGKNGSKFGGSPKVFEVGAKKESKTRSGILEERLLAIIFQSSPEKMKGDEYQKLFKEPFPKRIAEEFVKFTKNNKFDFPVFTESLPSELKDRFKDLILKDIEGVEETSVEKIDREIALIKKELQIFELKEKLTALRSSIENLEEKEVNGDLSKKEAELADLTKRLSEVEASEK